MPGRPMKCSSNFPPISPEPGVDCSGAFVPGAVPTSGKARSSLDRSGPARGPAVSGCSPISASLPGIPEMRMGGA